jgi:hypothetical protein
MAHGAALTALAAGAALAATALAAPSSPGHYDAELCVATRPGTPPTCGAADVEVRTGLVSVRVSDIVYKLALRHDQLDVVTMHGKMQIDEFSSPYQWEATTLVFSDPDKDVRYEVRIGTRKTAR